MKTQKAVERAPKGNRQSPHLLGFYSMPISGLLRKKKLAMGPPIEVIYWQSWGIQEQVKKKKIKQNSLNQCLPVLNWGNRNHGWLPSRSFSGKLLLPRESVYPQSTGPPSGRAERTVWSLQHILLCTQPLWPPANSTSAKGTCSEEAAVFWLSI